MRVVCSPGDASRQEFVLQTFDFGGVEEPNLFGELLVVGIFGLPHYFERVAVHVVDLIEDALGDAQFRRGRKRFVRNVFFRHFNGKTGRVPEVGAVFGGDADRPRVTGDEVDLLLHGLLRCGVRRLLREGLLPRGFGYGIVLCRGYWRAGRKDQGDDGNEKDDGEPHGRDSVKKPMETP